MCLIIWAIMLTSSTLVNCNVFTAMSHLEESVRVEIQLVQVLRDYISTEEHRLGELKRFSETSTKATDAAFENIDEFLANPVNAFLLIKRLHIGWSDVINGTLKTANINHEDLLVNISKYREHIPSDRDLQGAAKALLRLQDVYKVETQEFIKGSIKGYTTTPLTGEDCFDVGRAAYLSGDHYHVEIWLNTALEQLKKEQEERNTDNDNKVAKALDYLAFSHYRVGNLKKALNLSRELLKQEPSNPRVLRNVRNYVREIEKKEQEEMKVLEDKTNMRPPSNYLANREKYEALCRGETESPLSLSEVIELNCHYATNGNSMLILQPAKKEIVNYDPKVIVYHDVISDVEIAQLIELAKPKLKRSLVVDQVTQGGAADADYRISSSGWLEDHHTTLGIKLSRRISYITGLSTLSDSGHRHAEAWQVVNYGLGGQYEPHFDHSTDEDKPDIHLPGSRNRIATWMFYLSDVKAGGYTVFPEADVFVPPVKNGAVFWYNLRPSGKSDELTRHAGCPVLIGNKWVANKWIHEKGNEFNRLCDLHPDVD
ncbi:prolyl 4-hydroxylase subunit alpha-1-like [Glandiceps talaboti]